MPEPYVITTPRTCGDIRDDVTMAVSGDVGALDFGPATGTTALPANSAPRGTAYPPSRRRPADLHCDGFHTRQVAYMITPSREAADGL